jgi:hypothetical protein
VRLGVTSGDFEEQSMLRVFWLPFVKIMSGLIKNVVTTIFISIIW